MITRIAPRFLLLCLPLSLWAIAQWHTPKPVTAPTERLAHLKFQHIELPTIGTTAQTQRIVHPDLAHISGWIGSVGAAVALFDADGDGMANDYCLVDPRFDTVTVGPVPSTGKRFEPYEIRWGERDAAPGSVAPMGCLPAELDGDGQSDLVVYYWGRGPTLHLASEGMRERPLLPEFEIWHTNAGILNDIDGDGVNDLMFGNYFPEDVEILGTMGTPRMQHSMSRAQNAGRNRLFLGAIDGQFSDASTAMDAATGNGWTLGLGAADMDGDLLPEIYVSNDFGPDQLLHNRSIPGKPVFASVTGRRGLTDTRSRVLGKDSFKGMGVDFGDIDNDGNLDIYISSIAENYALMESHLLFRGTGQTQDFTKGIAPFKEVSGQLGVARSAWSWDARFVDFDGDGWSEILQATGFVQGHTDRWPELHELAMGNDELLRFPVVWPEFSDGDDLSGDHHDALYVRDAHGMWRNSGAAIGLPKATITRGIALGDIDGDGDTDALLARQWAPSVVMLNQTDARAGSATLTIERPNSAGILVPAIGASVVFRSEDETEPRLRRSVTGGDGHSGKSAPQVHVGFGAFSHDAQIIVDISWRDASGLQHLTVPVEQGHQHVKLPGPLTAQIDPKGAVTP